jgi:hypothetical protein
MIEKQLGYFKSKDKINMETRIITLIPKQILSLVTINNKTTWKTTITTLIEVMNMVFTRDKIKRNVNTNLP